MGSQPILPFEYEQLRITPGALENDVTEQPGLGAVVDASFRLENPIGAMWSYTGPTDMERLQKEEGYDSWTNVKGTWREPFFERYAGVFNQKAQLKLDTQIQREQEDRRTMHASSWPSYLLGLGAATLTDPTNLLPGGAVVRGAKVARAVGKGIASGAAAGATAVGASELVLQSATETRTAAESAFSIGGGALFMGLVGGVVSGVMSRADIAGATRYLEDLTNAERAPGEGTAEEALTALRTELDAARAGEPPPAGGPLRAGAAGAEARVEATIDDLTVAGGPITRGLVAITKWNPVGRNMTRTSPVARGVVSKIIENPFIMRMHLRGDEDLAQQFGQPVENQVRHWTEAVVADVISTQQKAYADYRKAGGTLRRKEFGEQITWAGIHGDKHADPLIAKAQAYARANLLNPLRDKAINTFREDGTRLLPEGIHVDNAESYMTEMWKPLAIEKNGGRDFKGLLRPDVERMLEEALARARRARDQKVGAAQGKIDDLSATPDQYMQRLGDIRQQLDTLNINNPAALRAEKDLSRLKRQEAKARGKGDIPLADTIRSQIDQAAKQTSIDHANYRTARNALVAQRRRLGRGRIGAAERQEQLRQAITDLEADSDAKLLRLHKQLGTLDQRMIDEGPEAHALELSEIRSEFAEIMESIVKAEERLATQQAKDREKLMTVADPEAAPRETAPPVDFDSTLDTIRSRPKRDPEKKMRAAPAMDFLKANGGVKPGSPLASELAKLGVFPKMSPKQARALGVRPGDVRGLFKEGGMERADNLVPDRDGRFADMADTQGYVDEAQLLDAVRSEIFGAPVRSPAELEEIGRFSEANQVADELEFELKDLGVDLKTMSNDEVLERLSVIQADTNRMREMYEGVPPRVSEDEGARELGELEEEGRIGEPPERELTKGEAVITERMRRREELFDMADRRKTDKLNKAAAEIERLQDVDPEAAVRALDELISTRVSQTAGRVERAGVRIHSMLRRAERLDPKRVDADIAELRGKIDAAERRFADTESIKYGEPGPDRESYIDDIVDNYYNKLTDRNSMGNTPLDLVMSKAGPLHERVFPFAQERYWEFMEHDPELIYRNYARKMASEVYLTEKHGSADMKFEIQRIQADYARLRNDIMNDPKLKPEQKTRRSEKLDKEEKAVIRDVAALRDQLRGVYMNKENSSGLGRTQAVISAINYMRIGGGFAIASLGDPARIMMTQGMGRFLNDGLVPLITNLKGVRGSFEESRLAGSAWADVTNGSAQARMADLDDPWSTRTPFEAYVMKAGAGFSKLNLLAYWNAFMKGWAGGVVQNRIISNVLKPEKMNAFEQAYMNHMGLTGEMAQRIATQFQTHGEFIKRMAILNTDDWTDPVARMAVRAAIRQDVNSTIITRSIGDIPLLANHPLGKMAVQFKSFALAGHQRIMIKGIQAIEMGGVQGGVNNPALGVLSGMITATGIGMFIYALKQKERGLELSDNPGRWMAEGLDRSGLYPILFEINNTIEKATGVGAYAAFAKLFPDKDQTGKASRYAQKSATSLIAGPTGDFVDTLYRVAQGAQRRDPKTGSYEGLNEGDVRGIRNLLPYSTLPLVKSIIDYGVMPFAISAAED